MVTTKKELIDVIHANEEKIKSFGVKRLGLFGSFVREEQDENSDVDFLVEFENGKKKLNNLIGLHEILSEATNRKIEVITNRGLSRHFGHKILASTEYVLEF